MAGQLNSRTRCAALLWIINALATCCWNNKANLTEHASSVLCGRTHSFGRLEIGLVIYKALFRGIIDAKQPLMVYDTISKLLEKVQASVRPHAKERNLKQRN